MPGFFRTSSPPSRPPGGVEERRVRGFNCNQSAGILPNLVARPAKCQLPPHCTRWTLTACGRRVRHCGSTSHPPWPLMTPQVAIRRPPGCVGSWQLAAAWPVLAAGSGVRPHQESGIRGITPSDACSLVGTVFFLLPGFIVGQACCGIRFSNVVWRTQFFFPLFFSLDNLDLPPQLPPLGRTRSPGSVQAIPFGPLLLRVQSQEPSQTSNLVFLIVTAHGVLQPRWLPPPLHSPGLPDTPRQATPGGCYGTTCLHL